MSFDINNIRRYYIDSKNMAWHSSCFQNRRISELFKKTGIPDYKKISGNREVFVLKKTEGKKSHIYVLSLWDSKESIIEFAGEDYEVAQYYPDDIKFLSEFEPFVKH